MPQLIEDNLVSLIGNIGRSVDPGEDFYRDASGQLAGLGGASRRSCLLGIFDIMNEGIVRQVAEVAAAAVDRADEAPAGSRPSPSTPFTTPPWM